MTIDFENVDQLLSKNSTHIFTTASVHYYIFLDFHPYIVACWHHMKQILKPIIYILKHGRKSCKSGLIYFKNKRSIKVLAKSREMASVKEDVRDVTVVPPPEIMSLIDPNDDGTNSRAPFFFCMYRNTDTVSLLQKYATETKHINHLIFTTNEQDINGVDMIVGFVQFSTNRTANGVIHYHYPWAGCKFFRSRRLKLKLKECDMFVSGPWIGPGLSQRKSQYPFIWQHGVDPPTYKDNLVVKVGRRGAATLDSVDKMREGPSSGIATDTASFFKDDLLEAVRTLNPEDRKTLALVFKDMNKTGLDLNDYLIR